MNIDKDAAKGTGNTFMQFNIGHVENLNPAATTVACPCFDAATEYRDMQPA